MTAKVLLRGVGCDAKPFIIRQGTLISTDAPLDNEGKGQAFSPN